MRRTVQAYPAMMKNRLPLPFFLAALSLFLAIPACPQPIPEPGKPGLIDCATDAVKSHAISMIPKVNECLSRVLSGDVAGCLISLISPVAGIGQDTIACLVRSQGSSFAASASANPNDQVSTRAAENARVFIRDRGYVFSN